MMQRQGEATQADPASQLNRKGIYFASKVWHAKQWQTLRDAGVLTVSTWIDEAGEGQTADYAELSDRCVAEISRASAVLLYCEPGEILKGALIEVGVALATGTPVLCVGECESLSRVFRKHPLWQEFSTVDEALEAAWKLRKQASPRNHPTFPVLYGQELRDTAQAVIDRWDSPKWKDLPATGEYIGRLRKAIATFDEKTPPLPADN